MDKAVEAIVIGVAGALVLLAGAALIVLGWLQKRELEANRRMK